MAGGASAVKSMENADANGVIKTFCFCLQSVLASLKDGFRFQVEMAVGGCQMKSKVVRVATALFVVGLYGILLRAFPAIAATVSDEGVPSTITIKRAIVLNDIVFNQEHGPLICTTEDGKVVYSIYPDRKIANTGEVFRLSEQTDSGLNAVLQNGYPFKELRGIPLVDMYITQYACWYYSNPDYFNQAFSDAEKTDVYVSIPVIKELADLGRNSAARSGSLQDQIADDFFDIKHDGDGMKLSEDGAWYVSPLITVHTASGSGYTVDISKCAAGLKSGAKVEVVDEAGQQLRSFDSGQGFRIRVAQGDVVGMSTVLEPSIIAVSEVGETRIYTPTESDAGPVAMFVKHDATLEKGFELTLNTSSHNQRLWYIIGGSAIFLALGILCLVLARRQLRSVR